MTKTCIVKGCKKVPGETYSFHQFPHIRNATNGNTHLERLAERRRNQWLLALGLEENSIKCRWYNVHICGRHFVSGQPARHTDINDKDWVPTLHLPLPGELKAGSGIVVAEGKVKPPKPTHCSIPSCVYNTILTDANTQVFSFPTLDNSNYLRRVLSEKRMLVWLQLLNQPSGGPKISNFDDSKICGLHFVSGTMAKLTEVNSIDWIPTVNMNIPLQFTDHVAHFDLYNLISLVKDSLTPENSSNFHNVLNKQQVRPPPAAVLAQTAPAASSTQLPEQQPSKPVRFPVGLKCILCLSDCGLKSLKFDQQTAIETIFKDALRVQSELICNSCNKMVTDFYPFYKQISTVQARLSLRTLNCIIPVQADPNPLRTISTSNVEQPAAKKPRLEDKKPRKLFERLSTDQFRCQLCQLVLATKAGLNDHFYHAHKIKITCRICQQSFSPETYTKHKKICVSKPKNAPDTKKPSTSAAANLPTKLSIENAIQEAKNKQSQEKYSCYICKEFFTPTQMIDHVKTHGVQTSDGSSKDLIACKQCNRAVLKDSMDRHMKTHETERARLKQLIKEQEERQTYTCCDMKFKSMAMLEQHKKKHKFVGSDDKIECPDCGSIITAKYYKLHYQMVHDKDVLPCDKCGKQMPRAALKRHRQTTCNDNPLVPCDVCGKMMREHLLRGHKSKVHINNITKCSFCTKTYDNKDYALSHERWAHREEFDKRRREGVKRVDHLNRSQLNQQLGVIESPIVDDERHSCPVCLNVHGTNAYVEAHVKKAHHKEYMSMIMGGVVVTSGDSVIEDFNAAEYLKDIMEQS